VQLLQGTTDSPTLIAETRRYVERQSKLASTIAERIRDAIASGEEKVVYAAYAGHSYARAAAIAYYRALRQLAQSMVGLETVEALIYHTLAYREESSTILLFAEPGTENMIGRLADAARYTGAKVAIVAPPLPPILKARVEDEALVEVNDPDPALAYIVSSVRLAAETAAKLSGVKLRVERLRAEMEKLEPIVDELIARYKGELEQISGIKKGARVAVVYTPTMEPPAILLGEALRARGPTTITPTSSALSRMTAHKSGWDSVVILSTDVEADSIRELQFKMSVTANVKHSIRVNLRTDPLTAPVYASILVKHLERLIGGEG
jgi:hypothetical protein